MKDNGSSNLVSRLRDSWREDTAALCRQAADEIERLRPMAESWESYEAAQERKAEMRPVETSPPLGQEPWRCSLPVITVQMLGDFGQEGFFEETDKPVRGVAGVSWSQAAVDFACLIQERRAEEPERYHGIGCATRRGGVCNCAAGVAQQEKATGGAT